MGCPVCATEVVVVAVPDAVEDGLVCSGQLLVSVLDAGRQGIGHQLPDAVAPVLGKRYIDEKVGVELLCTKAGDGSLEWDGRPLELKAIRPLPSSD
jgi:hypothetical protein